jgi:ribosomal protein S18 acetylase RimI-like enzyme
MIRFPPRPPGTTKLPDTFAIRPYSEADAEAVVRLVRELQEHEARAFDRLKPPDSIGSWYLDGRIKDIQTHGGAFLVAADANTVAGYATLLTGLSSADEPEEVPYTYAHVSDLCVGMAFRGRGIGRALMAECERLARAAGEKWLRLGVLAGNQPARRFYADLGMEEVFVTLEKKLS